MTILLRSFLVLSSGIATVINDQNKQVYLNWETLKRNKRFAEYSK